MKDIDFLTQIGMEYHYDTESWDRIHEHGIGPSGKTAMPVDKSGSSANAYKARDEAMDKAVAKGFTTQEAMKAIRDASRYEYDYICEVLNRRCWPL